jgi:hypothetical protein
MGYVNFDVDNPHPSFVERLELHFDTYRLSTSLTLQDTPRYKVNIYFISHPEWFERMGMFFRLALEGARRSKDICIDR